MRSRPLFCSKYRARIYSWRRTTSFFCNSKKKNKIENISSITRNRPPKPYAGMSVFGLMTSLEKSNIKHSSCGQNSTDMTMHNRGFFLRGLQRNSRYRYGRETCMLGNQQSSGKLHLSLMTHTRLWSHIMSQTFFSLPMYSAVQRWYAGMHTLTHTPSGEVIIPQILAKIFNGPSANQPQPFSCN